MSSPGRPNSTGANQLSASNNGNSAQTRGHQHSHSHSGGVPQTAGAGGKPSNIRASVDAARGLATATGLGFGRAPTSPRPASELLNASGNNNNNNSDSPESKSPLLLFFLLLRDIPKNPGNSSRAYYLLPFAQVKLSTNGSKIFSITRLFWRTWLLPLSTRCVFLSLASVIEAMLILFLAHQELQRGALCHRAMVQSAFRSRENRGSVQLAAEQHSCPDSLFHHRPPANVW